MSLMSFLSSIKLLFIVLWIIVVVFVEFRFPSIVTSVAAGPASAFPGTLRMRCSLPTAPCGISAFLGS